MSVFETLSVINVNDKKSKKNNLDYLSWAFAWSEVKKVYPEANSKVYENKQGYRDWETDRKSTRLNSSHSAKSRMPSSA